MTGKALNLTTAIFLIGLSCSVSAMQRFQSGENRVNVLELYTSEGCSSCPPADRYLSDLTDDNRLWKELIPLAFHVDYWDYLGWKDRFSSAIYSNRQRRYARENGLSTVYTPGFILNGSEWRSFFGLRKLSLVTDIRTGNLSASVNGNTIQLTFDNSITGLKHPIANIAVLGFGIVTEVKRGENSGKNLTHDFTVLGYKTMEMQSSADGFSLKTQLPDVSVSSPRMGVAVWVNEQGSQVPVQATGGWIDGS